MRHQLGALLLPLAASLPARHLPSDRFDQLHGRRRWDSHSRITRVARCQAYTMEDQLQPLLVICLQDSGSWKRCPTAEERAPYASAIGTPAMSTTWPYVSIGCASVERNEVEARQVQGRGRPMAISSSRTAKYITGSALSHTLYDKSKALHPTVSCPSSLQCNTCTCLWKCNIDKRGNPPRCWTERRQPARSQALVFLAEKY